MNRRSALSVIAMEGMAMVPNFSLLFHCWWYKSISHFLPVLNFSCLPCGVLVGEKNIWM